MKTIGIIGAMPSELVGISELLGSAEKIKKSGFEFTVFNYCDKKIVYACCGIAKVNAALCSQAMIFNFGVEAIINTGVAGGMNPDVKVCDIVISNEVLPHDLDLHFLNDYPPYCGIFKSDKKLIDTAVEICNENDINCFVQRIVSGEAFISDSAVKQDIVNRLNPYAVDMESSAIGHSCYLNEIPFVSVRCISDNADDEGAMSFDEFEKIAADRVAKIVVKMLERL